MEVHAQFTTKYKFILSLQQIFCSWGGKRPFSEVDPKHKHTKRGNPAPLWKNKSKKLFFIFFILNLLSAFFSLIIFTVMIINNNKQNSQTKIICENDLGLLRAEFNIIGFSILLINAIISRYLSKLEYASDQEWSRYTLLNLIFWTFLVGYNAFEYYQFITGFFKKKENKINNECINIFNFTIWTKLANMSIVTIVAFFQLNSILRNYCKLFSGKIVLRDDRIPYTSAVELKVINDF